MRKMSLGQVIGQHFDGIGRSGTVERFDPVSEVFHLSGYDKTWKDSVVWQSKNLSELDIEVVFADEERKMIADAKLTKQVAVKSAELLAAMTAWINNPNGRH